MVCFTTGRGSCFGSVPAPTMKLASNTPMYTRMQADMDVNCGVVIDGEATIAEMGEAVLEFVICVASGEVRTKAELLGQDDFIPWKRGVSL
jgi:altronate hydrolase